MNRIKELLNKRIDLLTLVVAEITVGLLLIAIYKELSLSNFLKIIDILAWPVVFFLAFYFFRKVFTYLFFSLRGFNFFGIKGELKSPEKMIEEEVEKRLKQIQDENKRNILISRYDEIIKKQSKLGDEKSGIIKNYLEEFKVIVDAYKELSKKYKKSLEREIVVKKVILEDLKKQLNERK
ncbi:hypothetical protein KAI56_03615 [Candidatus Parcubacteria bacterium]|nr:hypothetical protein [Candidatus Parcubacteria bacterium]